MTFMLDYYEVQKGNGAMKILKLIALALTLLLIVTLCACKNTTNENSSLPNNTASVSSKINTSSQAVNTSSSNQTVTSWEEIVVELTEREKILLGEDPQMYKLALENEGNPTRIANLMKKAQKGGSYTIGILGGSISGGAGATSESNKYANMVFNWWKENFPKAKFTLVNASIGSANPEMACYRLETDLLKHQPDFVIIDFSVNTYLDATPDISYATLLYRILSQPNQPGILAINFTAVTPKSYQDWSFKKMDEYPDVRLKEPIKKYDIPTLSYNNYVWNALRRTDEFGSEIINWKDIAADYIHPNNNGHRIAATIINTHLSTIKKNLSKISSTVPAVPALYDQKYLNVKYLTQTTSGVTVTGGVTKKANDHPIRRGWHIEGGKAGSLTVPLPTHSKVLIFMSFDTNAKGNIKVTGENGVEKIIAVEAAKTPTLVNLSEMGGELIVDSANLTAGSCDIYGICINP